MIGWFQHHWTELSSDEEQLLVNFVSENENAYYSLVDALSVCDLYDCTDP